MLGAVLVAATLALWTSGLAYAAGNAISVTTVTGNFYFNPTNCGGVCGNINASTPPAFTQDFPVINFNPPPGAVSCVTTVNVNTRPFTDVVPTAALTPCTEIIAQGNGLQAGSGSLFTFSAAYTGSFVLAGPSDITFNQFSDDGWVLGIGAVNGNQPTYVTGAKLNAPPQTEIKGYPVVGAFNTATAPTGQVVVVNFPAAGTYPFEFDYGECCGGELSFTTEANGAVIPPAPPPNATPELDSLVLFGTGLAGLAGYGLLRFRARRNGSDVIQ